MLLLTSTGEFNSFSKSSSMLSGVRGYASGKSDVGIEGELWDEVDS